jgi:hypothetical protein
MRPVEVFTNVTGTFENLPEVQPYPWKNGHCYTPLELFDILGPSARACAFKIASHSADFLDLELVVNADELVVALKTGNARTFHEFFCGSNSEKSNPVIYPRDFNRLLSSPIYGRSDDGGHIYVQARQFLVRPSSTNTYSMHHLDTRHISFFQELQHGILRPLGVMCDEGDKDWFFGCVSDLEIDGNFIEIVVQEL